MRRAVHPPRTGCRWAIAVPLVLASIEAVDGADPPDKKAPPLEQITRREAEGDAIAPTYLGLVYDLGEGLPRDGDVAAFLISAGGGTRNHANAQFVLGMAYALGRGVRQDYLTAFLWLDVALLRLTGEDKVGCHQLLRRVLWETTAAQLTEAGRVGPAWRRRYGASAPMARVSANSPVSSVSYETE